MTTSQRNPQDVIAPNVQPSPASRAMMWTGYTLSGLAILALSLDAGGKLLIPSTMIANTPPTGLPADIGFYRVLGSILAASVALYAWPRTSFLGAILLTGYLGGAVATNLRVSMPLFTFTLVGVYLGLLVWGGLWLRDARLRALFPWRD